MNIKFGSIALVFAIPIVLIGCASGPYWDVRSEFNDGYSYNAPQYYYTANAQPYYYNANAQPYYYNPNARQYYYNPNARQHYYNPNARQHYYNPNVRQTYKSNNYYSKSNLRKLASFAANKYGIDQKLFYALIKQESAWNYRAISHAGARGLTQIMPRTGKGECGLKRKLLIDPWQNLNCGAYYFSKLLKRFKNVKLALAAYNSGETRVARLGRIPRIRETQRYVKRIMADWRRKRL